MLITIDGTMALATTPADDELTIAQWERVHGLHMQHRRLAAVYDAELLELAPAYLAAIRREQRRWDLEHGEAVMTQSLAGMNARAIS